MDIYIVQPGDNIDAIATKYNMTTERLITDNGLISPYALTPGQALLILYPKETYTVHPGDTLESIASSTGTSILQLYRNNPLLYERSNIIPGESLVLSYNTERDIYTNGYVYYYINPDILKMTLPYLTHLSIFNYRILKNGDIITYGDDQYIIDLAKEFHTLPLLMTSALSPTGELELENVYELLLDQESQNRLIENMLLLLQERGFYGVNILLSYVTIINQRLYLELIEKISKILKSNHYIVIITMNPKVEYQDDTVTYKKIDYNSFSQHVDKIIFLQELWGTNTNPPGPISSYYLVNSFINSITKEISQNTVSIGIPLIAYNWTLPYVPGTTMALSLSLDSALIIAYEQRSVIQFDELSQSPYFLYVSSLVGYPVTHIVWFIDVRSIMALNDIISEYNLNGSGIWNIMSYNQVLWSTINARFNIIKIESDNNTLNI